MANFWDLTVDLISVFGNWIWLGLAAVGESTVDVAQGTILAVVNLLVGIITVLMYGPMSLFGVFINLLNIILHSITGLINTVITGGNLLISSFLNPFSNVYPGPWISVLGPVIIINVVLRVYFYAKDIEIIGNKV